MKVAMIAEQSSLLPAPSVIDWLTIPILANPWRGGHARTREEALEFVTRPIHYRPLPEPQDAEHDPEWRAFLWPPRGAGRPPNKLKHAQARRRALYVRLKLKPENARKQARTSARQAKLMAGDITRARVTAAFSENPSARAVDVADSLTSARKPAGVDVSTVYRARKPRR